MIQQMVLSYRALHNQVKEFEHPRISYLLGNAVRQ
jgi:hypothetical protein